MATTGSYSINFGIVDNATKTLKNINRELAAITAPVKRLKAEMARFADLTGITKIVGAFKQLGAYGLDAFRSFTRLLEPLAAITGAASIGGMLRLVTATASWSRELTNLGITLGVPPTKLQQLQNAAKLVGVSSESMTSSIQGLGDAFNKIARGEGSEQLQFLSVMKVSAAEVKQIQDDIASGNPAAAIAKISDAVNRTYKTAADRARALAAFGIGRDMMPFTNRGSEGQQKLENEASNNGLISDKQRQDLNDFNHSWVSLKESIDQVTTTIASSFAPVFTPLLENMRSWLNDEGNKQWISDEATAAANLFKDAIMAIVGWLKDGGWQTIKTDAAAIKTEFLKVIDALNGWTSAGKLVLDFFIGYFAVKMTTMIIGISDGLFALPKLASMSTKLASTSLGKFGLSIGTLMGKLGALGIAWEAVNQGQDLTNDPKNNGIKNLIHNMMFDMNPLHWTQTYHAENDKPGDDAESSEATSLFNDLTSALVELKKEMNGLKDVLIPGARASEIGAGGGLSNSPTIRALTGQTSNFVPSSLSNQEAGTAQQGLTELMGMGWTRQQAIGLLANFKQESGFRPNAVGDNGTAYGIGQWHPDRQAAFAAWAHHDIHGSTFAEQIAFANYELRQGKEQQAGKLLGQQTTSGASGAVGSYYYERPGNTPEMRQIEATNRAAIATAMDKQLGGAPVPSVMAKTKTDQNIGDYGPMGTQSLAHATVDIRLHGAGPQTQTTVKAKNMAPPKVDYAMPPAYMLGGS